MLHSRKIVWSVITWRCYTTWNATIYTTLYTCRHIFWSYTVICATLRESDALLQGVTVAKTWGSFSLLLCLTSKINIGEGFTVKFQISKAKAIEDIGICSSITRRIFEDLSKYKSLTVCPSFCRLSVSWAMFYAIYNLSLKVSGTKFLSGVIGTTRHFPAGLT